MPKHDTSEAITATVTAPVTAPVPITVPISILDQSLDGNNRAGKLRKISAASSACGDVNSKVNVYSRTRETKTEGRGSLTGWAACPLCNGSGSGSGNGNGSSKKYALGRGISMHLEQVHTPWKPGRAELARRKRIRRRVQGVVHEEFKFKFKNATRTRGKGENGRHGEESGELVGVHTRVTPTVISNIQVPKVKEGESRENYKERLLKLLLGDVWDRYEYGETSNSKQKSKAKAGSTCTDTDKVKVKVKDMGRPTHYQPSQQEVQEWAKKVLSIAQQLEREFQQQANGHDHEIVMNNSKKNTQFVQAGLDRNGGHAHSYKESLPPFIKAASDGNLSLLKQMVHDANTAVAVAVVVDQEREVAQQKQKQQQEQEQQQASKAIRALLDTKDRNGSSAEHWAAGNGHLHCLQYLMNLASSSLSTATAMGTAQCTSANVNTSKKRKRGRRRDGKTTFHYAARNGHTHVLRYLLDEINSTKVSKSNDYDSVNIHVNANVDITSGDGTTPLHLACYGGYYHTIQYLIQEQKANIYKVNDWGCGIGHWIAMSVQRDKHELYKILDYVKAIIGTDKSSFEIFGRVQTQGHSSIHKAAQKLNRHVIEWIHQESSNWTHEERRQAFAEDSGGHKPSVIWSQMGGDRDFCLWMECELEQKYSTDRPTD